MGRVESHPTWVCGLKHARARAVLVCYLSHPTWVCGLKQLQNLPQNHIEDVTPYVGVWIETNTPPLMRYGGPVTPYVGVWIETIADGLEQIVFQVTPYVGVWIETRVFR